MEHCMKEVLMRTKPKDSFTLVVSDSSANIQTTFSHTLSLQANRDYELAMVNLETYYSFANIRKGNNSFKWSIDERKTWTLLVRLENVDNKKKLPPNARTATFLLADDDDDEKWWSCSA